MGGASRIPHSSCLLLLRLLPLLVWSLVPHLVTPPVVQVFPPHQTPILPRSVREPIVMVELGAVTLSAIGVRMQVRRLPMALRLPLNQLTTRMRRNSLHSLLQSNSRRSKERQVQEARKGRASAIPLIHCHVQLHLHRRCHRPTLMQCSMPSDTRGSHLDPSISHIQTSEGSSGRNRDEHKWRQQPHQQTSLDLIIPSPFSHPLPRLAPRAQHPCLPYA